MQEIKLQSFSSAKSITPKKMASRVRGSSIKEPSKISYAKDRFHDSEESSKTYKNGTRENRYHFGMQREEEASKNGRDYKEETKDDPDFLYRRSREYFGTWDFKDIAQEEQGRPRKHEDVRMTNGKSKIESTKHEVLYDEVESPRNHLKIDTDEVEREEAAQRTRKRENLENDPRGRSRNEEKKDVRKNDERDLLLKEIESLAVDGKSPDRRIRAMIERFKTREEEKLKVRRDRNSSSPEREEQRSKNRRDWNSGSPEREEQRSKGRRDRNSTSPEVEERSKGRIEGRRIEDGDDASGKCRNLKDEDERRAGRSKTRDTEKLEHERSPSGNRLNDRRSRSREKPDVKEREEDTRKSESFRQKSDVERSHRRRSREIEDDRTRDGSRKRNTYVYEAAPEEFDVRIQRYERALLEPRKDPELSRRVSPRNSDADLGRKESFKDPDRQVARKSSFKGESRKNKDRDSSLNRRTSFKDQESDPGKKNSSKNQDSGVRYFGNLENEACRKNSKDIGGEGSRKNSFKEQNAEYGRICFKSREDEFRNREDEAERKNSLKGQSGGVSRITFKERNDESGMNSYREAETDVERVGFKDRNLDGRKNSFKEKSVEFGGIFYKDDDEDERRNFHGDNEANKVSFGDSERKRSPNERYEFGKVSLKNSEERQETRRSPTKEYDRELDRKSSFKDKRNREDENEPAKMSFGMNERTRSPNGRYEFGKVSFKGQQERSETRRSPTKDHDREVERKSSFKDRRNLREVEEHEPSKMSFLVSERARSPNGRYEFGKVSFKNHEDPESRRSPTKDHNRESERRNSFKDRKNFHGDQDAELNRVSFEDSPRKRSPNGRYEFGKVSFKTQEEEARRHPSKDNDREIDRRSSSKDRRNFEQDNDPTKVAILYEDSERKRSPNGRYEFGKVSFKTQEEEARRHPSKDNDREIDRRSSSKDRRNFEQDNDPTKVAILYEDSERKRSPNGRYEFGKVSFKTQEEEARRHPSKDNDREIDRRSSSKDRRNFEQDNDPTKVAILYEDSERKRSPNGRYDISKVTFKNEEENFPSKDIDSDRRTSQKDDEGSKRRSTPRSRARGNDRSDRHSRALSPPKRNDPDIREDSRDQEAFCARSWHETNRVFATKYLRDNSKLRRADLEESAPETALVHHEFRDSKVEGFPEDDVEDVKHCKDPRASGSNSRTLDSFTATTHERNGATIIRIRSSPENPGERVERRRRRRPQESFGRRRHEEDERESEDDEEDEDDKEVAENDNGQRSRGFSHGRALPTPSRRIWNYREGGVLITDVEEGQPCLQCGETCPGFSPHSWRKNCTSCKCPREAHDVCHEEWVSVRSRLGLKGDESTSPVGFDPRNKGLAWAPPGLPAHKVEEYFSLLPEISVPRLGTPGERHRDRQLAIQLPKQDLARAYCRHLDPNHASSADDFMAARNEIALDIGSVLEVLERDLDCAACQAPLKYGSFAISAIKLGLFYHPACFRCSDCKELLVDLAYCVHDDTLFCERHYAEQLKPRCAACDELIFSGEYTKAMNKDWHSGHFCCWQCDESLTGQRYVLRDEHPYCIKCYESVFANGCEECNKIIGIDSKDLSYKDKHWHEACFLCNRCRVSLVDKQFGSKVDKIYCGNCYDAQFASRCDGCGEIFRAGTKKMEYKTRQWHEKCFCCVVCKNPIGTKSFIPREQEIYCAGCYEDKFATRCVKCNKIITSGGVTYKNEPWHRDCFTCSNCNNSLAGQRFTSRDDKPYCADCFGELFAKRCTACSKPITGIGGTRFISFEDRHWHNDCFICAGCKTSLVGRGFITDGEDIICPECAKRKLM